MQTSHLESFANISAGITVAAMRLLSVGATFEEAAEAIVKNLRAATDQAGKAPSTTVALTLVVGIFAALIASIDNAAGLCEDCQDHQDHLEDRIVAFRTICNVYPDMVALADEIDTDLPSTAQIDSAIEIMVAQANQHLLTAIGRHPLDALPKIGPDIEIAAIVITAKAIRAWQIRNAAGRMEIN